MQDTGNRQGDNSCAGVQDAKPGDNTRVDADVKRVVAQLVEASRNGFARQAADRCRQMMVDESPARVPSGGNAWYLAGRNDVLRELAKWFAGQVSS